MDSIDLAHSVENYLWKRLWTCGKSDYLLQQLLPLLSIMMIIVTTMIMIMIFLDPQKVKLNPYTMFLM